MLFQSSTKFCFSRGLRPFLINFAAGRHQKKIPPPAPNSSHPLTNFSNEFSNLISAFKILLPKPINPTVEQRNGFFQQRLLMQILMKVQLLPGATDRTCVISCTINRNELRGRFCLQVLRALIIRVFYH